MTREIGGKALQSLEAERQGLANEFRVIVLRVGGRAVSQRVCDGLAGHLPQRAGRKEAPGQCQAGSAYHAVPRHIPLNTGVRPFRYNGPEGCADRSGGQRQ